MKVSPIHLKTAKTDKRLFVVDHMCVLPYGHNQGAVALFQRTLASHFTDTHALVPKALSATAAAEKGFTRCLNYPYNAFADQRFESWLSRCVKNQTLRAGFQRWLRRAEYLLLIALIHVLCFDFVLWKTERNWHKQFKTYRIASGDLIFFPSADYYGAAACLNFLMKGKTKTPPRLHLRMIGVMENASLGTASPCDHLMKQVQRAIVQGIDITVSAETPAYASHLAQKLGLSVGYFPYPLSGDAMPMPSAGPIIAASIGSGRGDKGYFLLADIVQKTPSRMVQPVMFEIQSVLPNNHASFRPDYERRLANIANVRILKPVLTDQEILDFYRRSYVALLPYDPNTYELRGSAVYQEALAYGRPVVCLAGVGFADLIERYGNGYACHDVQVMAASIEQCVSIPPSEWEKRLAAARSLYDADVNQAIKQLLTGPSSNYEFKAVSEKEVMIRLSPFASIFYSRAKNLARRSLNWPVIGRPLQKAYVAWFRPLKSRLDRQTLAARSPPEANYVGPYKFIMEDEDLVRVFNALVGEIYEGQRVYPLFNLAEHRNIRAETRPHNLSKPTPNAWLEYFEPIRYDSEDRIHEDAWHVKLLPRTTWLHAPKMFRHHDGAIRLRNTAHFLYWRQTVHQAIQSKIKLRHDLRRQVDQILAEMPGRKIGVSVDTSSSGAVPAMALYGDYFTLIDQLIDRDENYSLFLASDIEPVIAAFRRKYGERVFCNERANRKSADDILLSLAYAEVQGKLRAKQDDTLQAGKDTILDLFTLASCSDFVASAVSNYAQACCYLNPSQAQHFVFNGEQ